MIQRPQFLSDRRFLVAGAGVGGVLLGLAVLRMSSPGSDDAAVGPVPATTRPQRTTTVTQPAPAAEVAPALITVPDPFAQLVNVPQAQAAQTGAVAAVPGQATQAAPAAQASTTQTTRAATTTTTAATPATTPVQATPPPVVQANAPTIPPDTVSTSVGPTALPGVPVNVCVGEGPAACFPTPPATSVALTVAAATTPGAARRPAASPGVCSNGQGVAVVVDPGSAGADVAVVVALTIGGQPTAYSLVARGIAPDRALIVSACVPPGVGGPSPPSTIPPGPTSLLGGVLQPVLTVLGVSAPPGP